MKKMTAFFTIALLVCIAICVAFASNQNRNSSVCHLYVPNPDDNLPHTYKSEYNYGSDSEGPLSSSGASYTGYWRNENEELRFGASGSGYVSCYTDNDNYETTYKLYAKVPEGLQYPNERNPQTLPMEGSFSDSVSRSGEGNGNGFSLGGASGSASASGKNPSNNDQHTTSAASPTSSTARVLNDPLNNDN